MADGEAGSPRGQSGALRSTRAAWDAPSPEVEVLRLAVHSPEAVAPYLEEILFTDAVHLASYRSLARSETLHDAIESAEPEAAALLRRLAVEGESEADPLDVVARLVRLATLRALAEIEAEARASQQAVDLTWPRRRMEELEERHSRVEAAEQLVAWLVRNGEEGE